MAEVVADASAILAVILREPGQEEARRLVPGAFVSSVNLAEVVSKLLDQGASEQEAKEYIRLLSLVVVPFDPEDGWSVGLLRPRTRHLGLSLGDRACLALAFSRRIPAVTKDRSWAGLGLGPAVKVVRR